MALPIGLQLLLRQYDCSEIDWTGVNNQQLLDRIALWEIQKHLHTYIHSRQFATDMRLFSRIMYNQCQLQTPPAPNPDRILKNAIKNIRRRI